MSLALSTEQANSFKQLVRENAAALEQSLADLLPKAGTELESRVINAMRYSTLGGGKRLRPFLVRYSALLGAEASEQSILRTGAAMEVMHTYSLIHDDLPCMDDDSIRRGQPTCHVEYDEATAVLAADALQCLAFELLADPQTHADADIRCQLVQHFAKAAGAHGMVGGQMVDLHTDEGRYAEQAILSQAQLQRLHAMKTGAIIEAACHMGALIGGVDEATTQVLAIYSKHFGLAYQITDDVLDETGSAEALGKTPGKDAASGKSTFVSLLGLEGAQQAAEATVQQALDALAPLDDHAEPLRQLAQYLLTRTK